MPPLIFVVSLARKFVVGIVVTLVVKGREPARRALDDLHSGAVGE